MPRTSKKACGVVSNPTDDTVVLLFRGVSSFDPGRRTAMLFQDPQTQRILFVWCGLEDAARLFVRINETTGRRPTSQDCFVMMVRALLSEHPDWEMAVTFRHCNEGVFMVDLSMPDGSTRDIRPSDAACLIHEFDSVVVATKDIMSRYGIFVTDEQMDELTEGRYTPLSPPEATPASASGDPESDAEFARFMNDLGVQETDLVGKSNPKLSGEKDTDVTDGEEED